MTPSRGYSQAPELQPEWSGAFGGCRLPACCRPRPPAHGRLRELTTGGSGQIARNQPRETAFRRPSWFKFWSKCVHRLPVLGCEDGFPSWHGIGGVYGGSGKCFRCEARVHPGFHDRSPRNGVPVCTGIRSTRPSQLAGGQGASNLGNYGERPSLVTPARCARLGATPYGNPGRFSTCVVTEKSTAPDRHTLTSRLRYRPFELLEFSYGGCPISSDPARFLGCRRP